MRREVQQGMQEAKPPHHTPQRHVPRIANPPITNILPMRQWIAPHIRREQVHTRILLQATQPKPQLPIPVHRQSEPHLPLSPWITEDPLWNPPHPLRRPHLLDRALPLPRHAQQWPPFHMLQRLLPLNNSLRVPSWIRQEALALPGLVSVRTQQKEEHTPRIQQELLEQARPQLPRMRLVQQLPLRLCVQQLHDQNYLRQDVL